MVLWMQRALKDKRGERMSEPSSLSWSNHYGLSPYGHTQQTQTHEQGQQPMRPFKLHNPNQNAQGGFQGDGNGQAEKGQMHDYNEDTSFQHRSSNSANAETRKVSWEDIVRVKHFVETCIKSYMTKKEIIDTLSTHAKIEPSFTRLVWQRLEKENEGFFRNYYIWLKVKEQILQFNQLLQQQHQLMMSMEKAIEIQPQMHTGKQLCPGPHELAAQFTAQGNSLPQSFLGDRQVERTMQVPMYSHSSLYDASSARNINFSQASSIPNSGNFSSSMQSGEQFSASNMESYDGNGHGFLQMENLESMPGSLEQLSMPRRTPELFMEFPSHQGGYSGHSLFSSNMDGYINQPFQNGSCDDRLLDPNQPHLYDSFGGS